MDYFRVVLIVIFGCFIPPLIFATIPEYYYKEYAPAFDNYVAADYTFEYSVSDPISGDHKSQWEYRKGGTVKGIYTFLEADGTTRYVEYVADKQGFRANVKRISYAPNNIAIDHSAIIKPLNNKYSTLAFDDVDILVTSHNFGEETEVHGLTGNEEDDSAYTT